MKKEQTLYEACSFWVNWEIQGKGGLAVLVCLFAVHKYRKSVLAKRDFYFALYQRRYIF